MTTKYTFCGCLTSTCTTSSSLEKRNGLSLRSLFKELSWIDENRKARLWNERVSRRGEMKIFKPPFFAAFAISSSPHNSPAIASSSNIQFMLEWPLRMCVCCYVLTRLLLLRLLLPLTLPAHGVLKNKPAPENLLLLLYNKAATTMAKTLSIYSLRWESSATQHCTHTRYDDDITDIYLLPSLAL
jgi:hypothetical protein